MRVRHEPPTFKELLLIALIAIFAMIVVALSVGCSVMGLPVVGPSSSHQIYFAERVAHYASVLKIPQPEINVGKSPTNAGWVTWDGKTCIVNVNGYYIDGYEDSAATLRYLDALAAHETCHCAHHDAEESDAIEASANACANEIVNQ